MRTHPVDMRQMMSGQIAEIVANAAIKPNTFTPQTIITLAKPGLATIYFL